MTAMKVTKVEWERGQPQKVTVEPLLAHMTVGSTVFNEGGSKWSVAAIGRPAELGSSSAVLTLSGGIPVRVGDSLLLRENA